MTELEAPEGKAGGGGAPPPKPYAGQLGSFLAAAPIRPLDLGAGARA